MFLLSRNAALSAIERDVDYGRKRIFPLRLYFTSEASYCTIIFSVLSNNLGGTFFMTKYNFKLNKRRSLIIAYTAILIALDMVLNTVALDIGYLSIAFTYIPCFVAGMFLGPISGGIVGLCGDLLGAVTKGYSPSPVILISCMLIGVIPGLIFMIKKIHPFIKLAISLVLSLFICTMGLSTLGTWLIASAGGSSKTFAAFWLTRLTSQPIVVAINAVLLFILYYPLKKFVFDKMGSKTTTDKDIEQLSEQSEQNVALENQINYIENKQDNTLPMQNETFSTDSDNQQNETEIAKISENLQAVTTEQSK